MMGRFRRPDAPAGGVQVRPMRRFGRRTISRLTLSQDQYAFLPPINRVLSRFRMKRDAHEYVIWLDSQAVGYFQLNLDRRETAHYAGGDDVCGLEAMFIDVNFQGQGIAVLALAQLGGIVSKFHPHIRRINLTVACENDIARRAYARAGFNQTGTILKIRNEPDQIVLTRFARRKSERNDTDNTQGVEHAIA